MSDIELEKVDEIWVSTGEGVEFTGYNQQYLRKLALKMSRLPVEERLIQVRNRADAVLESVPHGRHWTITVPQPGPVAADWQA